VSEVRRWTGLHRFVVGRTLAECLDSGRDNFLLLRLIAALIVIFGHSYQMTGTEASIVDPLHRFFPHIYSHLVGVVTFFAISGFLITLSFQRQPDLLRFARARVLRLWPAFIVVVAAWAFVFGPMLTALPLHDYFAHGDDYGTAYRYFWSNISLFQLWLWLPGLFADNPIPRHVNGSLWTISWEAAMYVLVAIAGALRLLRFPWLASAVIFTLVATMVLWPFYTSDTVWSGTSLFGYVLAACFGAGSILCLLRRYVPISTGLMILLAIVAIVGRNTQPLIMPAILYFVFWFAYVPRLPALPRSVDLSYGTYLWAFPVQQTVVATTGVRHPLVLFAIVVPIVLMIAALSWHFVEQPALRFKND
jgi:peptidoglycan/LPS O-acetylase OafA/YrhL